MALSVFPLQLAKLAVLANPVIYVVMNKAVSVSYCSLNVITIHILTINYYITFQFQKAFINLLPRDLGQVVGEKAGIERGDLSATAIGRRQQPKFFGRLWTTIMVRKSGAETSSYYE